MMNYQIFSLVRSRFHKSAYCPENVQLLGMILSGYGAHQTKAYRNIVIRDVVTPMG